MSGIFISHAHGDQPIADALGKLITSLFGQKLPVNYSSKKELDGGIAPGDDWFRWIVRQVIESDIAFILLTPSSVQKPWVVWEAGAVAGAAFATAVGEEARRVYPITYALKTDEIPSPFARTQLVVGTQRDDMAKLTADLFERFGKTFSLKETVEFGRNQSGAVEAYLEGIGEVIMRLPLMVTEANVHEWLLRLDELKQARRYSEAAVLEGWLDIAFGRDEEDRLRPLDLRVHRLLGELYANGNMPADAARQFNLARQLASRDIFVLRLLGKAYLDQKDRNGASKVIAEIEALDTAAFERNPENAALKARWCEQDKNLRGAREVLDIAFRATPSSYYLGDRLGQILLQLGEMPTVLQSLRVDHDRLAPGQAGNEIVHMLAAAGTVGKSAIP